MGSGALPPEGAGGDGRGVLQLLDYSDSESEDTYDGPGAEEGRRDAERVT